VTTANTLTRNRALAEHIAAIRQRGKRMISDAIEIGRRLKLCKEIVGHGRWLPWLDEQFGWRDRTALNFMRVHTLAAKSEKFSDLALDDLAVPLSSMYALAAPQTSSEAVAEILERARKGKRVTIAEVSDTIARFKGLDGFNIDNDSEDDDWFTKYLMAKQLVPNGGNDDIQTPRYLANQIVKHFLPLIDVKNDLVLEPCAGKGAFVRAFKASGIKSITTCEIKNGRDFFDYDQRVDWIITNPPFSQMREFLRHGFRIANNVVFLTFAAHVLGMKARLQDMNDAKWGIKELLCVPTPPKPWPQSGFQVCAAHLRKGWRSTKVTFTTI
jgi:hypothetical protein